MPDDYWRLREDPQFAIGPLDFTDGDHVGGRAKVIQFLLTVSLQNRLVCLSHRPFQARVDQIDFVRAVHQYSPGLFGDGSLNASFQSLYHSLSADLLQPL